MPQKFFASFIIDPNIGSEFTCHVCKKSFRLPNNKRLEWKAIKRPCPYCGETYCIRNKGERQLFRLQDDFFDNLGDRRALDRILSQMYEVLVYYSQSLIKIKFSNIEHIPITKEILEDKSSLAAAYTIPKYSEDYKFYLHPELLIEYMEVFFAIKQAIEQSNSLLIRNHLAWYLRKKFYIPFMIDSSFSSYQITAALRYAFFDKEFHDIQGGSKNRNKKDVVSEVVSIDQMFEGERGESSAPIFPVYEHDGRIQSIEKEEAEGTLLNTILDLIEGMGEHLHPEDNLIRLTALTHYFEGKEVYAEKIFRIYGRRGKRVYMETIDIVKNYVKDRI